MKKIPVGIILFALACAAPGAAERQKVANAEIEKLLAAGMGDEVILNVIAGGEPDFDTSVDALITLKQKGASPAVLAAVTNRHPAALPSTAIPVTTAVTGESTAPAEAINLADVILIDGEQHTTMVYSTPDRKAAGMIWSALAEVNITRGYWVLQGARAKLRIRNHNLSFFALAPRNARPEESINLVLWAARPNGTREVMVSRPKGISDSMTTSAQMEFPKQRMVALEFAKTKEQLPPAGDRDDMTRYEARLVTLLVSGEYSLQVGGRVYDFGVDP
jgi:hypothetical protein